MRFAHFFVGRKNWRFCDSVKGAESSAIVYSIVETAKAHNLELYDYLLMVLSLLRGGKISHLTRRLSALCRGIRAYPKFCVNLLGGVE